MVLKSAYFTLYTDNLTIILQTEKQWEGKRNAANIALLGSFIPGIGSIPAWTSA